MQVSACDAIEMSVGAKHVALMAAVSLVTHSLRCRILAGATHASGTRQDARRAQWTNALRVAQIT